MDIAEIRLRCLTLATERVTPTGTAILDKAREYEAYVTGKEPSDGLENIKTTVEDPEPIKAEEDNSSGPSTKPSNVAAKTSSRSPRKT